jgi:hypothetical protein
MATQLQRINRRILLFATLGILLFATVGCGLFSEATFKLAGDSRLPKWVSLPPGLQRANSSVMMTYYNLPWGGRAEFLLQDERSRTIDKKTGTIKCREPLHLQTASPKSSSGYPSYEVITINGVTEIIEHRKMEPVFYVTDDAAIWKQYESTGCS